MSAEPSEDNNARVSIWTVDAKWRAAYLAQFVIFSIISIGYVCWFEIYVRTEYTVAETVRAIILDTGLAGVSSAIVSLVNTDIGRFLMVLAGMLEDALKERRKRQIAEATAEATAPLKEALKEAEAAAAESAEAAEESGGRSGRSGREGDRSGREGRCRI